MQASASPGGQRATFPVRMLRTVAVSPDGKRVAYQALGYIYLRDLPERHAEAPDDADRATSSSTRPGRATRKSLVYATWNDEKLGSDPRGLGSRRRLAHRDGQARPLPRPRLLARRRQDRLHEGDRRIPALRRAGPPSPASTSSPPRAESPSLVVEDAFAPRFGKASDRVFFVKTEGGGDQIAPEKRVFASVELDGSDVHEYYLSELAQEFAISPDGKWLAFREGFQAYVTPFIETGRRVDIGPKSKAVPVTRVSKDAGEYLALLRRLDAALLVLRPPALRARPQGGLRLHAGRAREAARASGRRA